MSNEKTTLILDSSQISQFCVCPTLWDNSSRQRLERIVEISKEGDVVKHPMECGTYGHSLLEYYYKLKATKIEDVKTGAHSPPIPEILSAEEIRLVEKRFEEYTYTYDGIRDIIVCDPKMVEVGFSELIYEDEDYRFILEGKIDIAEAFMSGQKIIVDHKFQMRKKNLYKKAIQFRNYAMIMKAPLLMINYIRLTKTVTTETYNRDIASFSYVEHEKWKGELIDIFKKVAIYLDTKDTASDAITKNRSSCDGKYGYQCQYIQLCDELIPSVAVAMKETLYRIREEWSPWKLEESDV